MILRQGLNFAVHAAGGVAMGLALVAAGTMLARLAARQAKAARAADMDSQFSGFPRGPDPEPDQAPPPEH